MKHIKTYTKLFESDDTDIEEMIKELFFELQDEGFDVEVETNYSSAYKLGTSKDKVFSYYVIIIAHFGNPVNWRDIGVLRKNNGRVRDNPTVDWVFIVCYNMLLLREHYVRSTSSLIRKTSTIATINRLRRRRYARRY